MDGFLGIDDYIDASHFVLISLFLVVIGALLLTWNQSCKDSEFKDEKTSRRMRVAGAALVTTGSVATVLSIWLFSSTVVGTKRVRVTSRAPIMGGGSPYGSYGSPGFGNWGMGAMGGMGMRTW